MDASKGAAPKGKANKGAQQLESQMRRLQLRKDGNAEMAKALGMVDDALAIEDLDRTPCLPGEWTAERLRLALQTALIATELAPVDIFHVYKGRQGAEALTKANFHTMMRKMVDDDALWEAQLKDVTREAYTAMVGTDRVASLVKFQAWLGKGWRENHLHRHKQQQ